MPRWSSSDPAVDQRLVKGLNEGEDSAFAALYDRYAQRLYDYALSMTRDPSAAADIVHDTFIDAFRRAPRMRDREHLGPWLYAALRRRCLMRSRRSSISWEWDHTSLEKPDARTGLPGAELRDLVEAVTARLSFADQEVLLLVSRHGLSTRELAVALGTGRHRTGRRVSAAQSRLAAAVGAELRERSPHREVRTGSGNTAEAPEAPEADTSTAVADSTGTTGSAPSTDSTGAAAGEHGVADGVADGGKEIAGGTHGAAGRNGGESAGGQNREKLTCAMLLSVPPVPVLPAALRHRVMHTATDPELARHRADIVARGGNLTSTGMPRQPDVASPLVRRWVFTGSGVAGALMAALVTVLIFDPGLPIPSIDWFDRHPEPSPSVPAPTPTRDQRIAPPVAGGTGQAAPPITDPQGTRPTPAPNLPSGPPTPTPAPPPGAGSGILRIGPAKVDMATNQEVAVVKLTAVEGDVVWTAQSSSTQLLLSASEGTVSSGASQELKISLRYGKWTFPGEATVTFETLTRGPSGGGLKYNVNVTWKGASLL